jgi:hypothetical protein
LSSLDYATSSLIEVNRAPACAETQEDSRQCCGFLSSKA